MRSALLLIAFCSAIFSLNAQDDVRKGYHVMNYGALLSECDITGNLTNPVNNEFVQADWKFKVVNVVGNNYIIQLLHFPDSYKSADTLNTTFFAKPTGAPVYYLMPATIYQTNAERLQSKHSFTVGAATTIIKIRPGSKELVAGEYPIYFDFANDFNIGALFGYKYKPNRKVDFAQNFLGGISFSSIRVDSASTQGVAKTESNNSALTFSVGYLLEFNKFQFGVFSGIDLLSGEIGRKWIYRNRPWIGLSLGYSIFKTKESPSTQ